MIRSRSVFHTFPLLCIVAVLLPTSSLANRSGCPDMLTLKAELERETREREQKEHEQQQELESIEDAVKGL